MLVGRSVKKTGKGTLFAEKTYLEIVILVGHIQQIFLGRVKVIQPENTPNMFVKEVAAQSHMCINTNPLQIC